MKCSARRPVVFSLCEEFNEVCATEGGRGEEVSIDVDEAGDNSGAVVARKLCKFAGAMGF